MSAASHSFDDPDTHQHGSYPAGQPASDLRWLSGPHAALVTPSPEAGRARVRAWISQALSEGWKVYAKHAHPDRDSTTELATLAGAGPHGTNQAEVLDAARIHADTGGEQRALGDWHTDLLAQARREGYAGMAITCDGPALAVIAPDEDERAAHEQDLTALAATSPLRVLCRYATDREPDAWLAGVLGAHPDLADVTFAAARDGQRLAVAGEIDAGTADRFAAILHSAVDAGVHTLDLAGLDFLAAAGVRALDLALEQLAARDQPLTLTRVPRPVRRVVDLCGITASDTLRIAP